MYLLLALFLRQSKLYCFDTMRDVNSGKSDFELCDITERS